MSLQLAAASYVCIHYALMKKRKERRWWQRQLYTSREMYSGSSLLADLNFQSVSGLYKNFTRMSPSEFEFLIHLIAEKNSKKDTTFRKAISVQEKLALTLLYPVVSVVRLSAHVAYPPFLAPALVCGVTHRHIYMPLEY